MDVYVLFRLMYWNPNLQNNSIRRHIHYIKREAPLWMGLMPYRSCYKANLSYHDVTVYQKMTNCEQKSSFPVTWIWPVPWPWFQQSQKYDNQFSDVQKSFCRWAFVMATRSPSPCGRNYYGLYQNIRFEIFELVYLPWNETWKLSLFFWLRYLYLEDSSDCLTWVISFLAWLFSGLSTLT